MIELITRLFSSMNVFLVNWLFFLCSEKDTLTKYWNPKRHIELYQFEQGRFESRTYYVAEMIAMAWRLRVIRLIKAFFHVEAEFVESMQHFFSLSDQNFESMFFIAKVKKFTDQSALLDSRNIINICAVIVSYQCL